MRGLLKFFSVAEKYRFANPEIYQKAEDWLAKKFKYDPKGYRAIMSGVDIKRATGSSLIFDIAIESVLPPNERIMSLEDLRDLYKNLHISEGVYVDIPDVLLYSPTPSFKKNAKILKSLTELVEGMSYCPEVPLRISRLGIIPDNNKYGFKFTRTENTTAVNDQRLGIQKEKGFSGLFLYNYDLFSTGPNIALSTSRGRTIIARY